MTVDDDGRAAAEPSPAHQPPLAGDERSALIAAHERRVEAVRDSAQFRVGALVIAAARSPRASGPIDERLWG